MFAKHDHAFMKLALEEAKTALTEGDYPVGAVLTVNNSFLGSARNTLFSDERTVAHAEHSLISHRSATLRKLVREQPESTICLYTTLEPCLMCLGISVMHRISRIVFACPDPSGGASTLDYRQLGSIYQKWWPQFESGLYGDLSCDLIILFLKKEKLTSWKEMLFQFQELQIKLQEGK